MEETWRPIPGHAGYEVSDLGRVRSLDRVITKTWRGRTVNTPFKGRVLRLQRMAGSGYLYANLTRGAMAYVHRLVLEAFVGPGPAGYQAAHWDGNKGNNVPGNLRWATVRENAADKLRHGTALFGARTPQGRKMQCNRGHPFDEENTRRYKSGRVCRTCQRERRRR